MPLSGGIKSAPRPSLTGQKKAGEIALAAGAEPYIPDDFADQNDLKRLPASELPH